MLGESCTYANNEVDNDKASENKDYVHADKCFYNYNAYFYDSFNEVVVSNESDTFEFGVQVSYKITENYLIVERNRPHGIYSQYGYEDLDLFDLCLEAINREDLFYKQIHYYNFKTGLLEYQGISMKSITCNYKLGSEISLEGRISFVKANNEAMKLHNKISKYVKSNTSKFEG